MKTTRHDRPTASLVMLSLGIVCLIIGGLWLAVLPTPSRHWTEQQAKELQQAGIGVHDALHAADDGHAHSHDHHPGHGTLGHEPHQDNSGNVESALQQFDALQRDLRRAQTPRIRPPGILLGAGLLLIFLGGAGRILALTLQER